MIDIHAHILPGIDDGPATLEESLEMARIAVKDGIHTMIATPHCLNGLYFNWRTDILRACEQLNSALKKQEIPLTLLPGSEVRLSPEILEEIKKGRLMTLNDTGRYLSLELPDQFLPQSINLLINRLKERDITPIITHPERNLAIQHNIELLHEFISAGALIQITAGSLTGKFGPVVLKCCQRLVESDMAHFMGTDAHSPTSRPPTLFAAFKKLSSLLGEKRAKKMMSEAPNAMLLGGNILY